MTKEAQINVRLTEEEAGMLDALKTLHVRSTSDEVRFLIRREYGAEFGMVIAVPTSGEDNSAT